MSRKQQAFLVAGLAAGLVFVLFALSQQVAAIPAFARKYETSCQTCHVAFPKLNAFGEAFRNNGYRFPAEDEEELVKQKQVPLGAPAWKKVWPKAVWPADIPPSIPVALLVTNTFDVMPDNAVSNDFALPNEVELFTGGTLGESFSFYGGITLLEKNEFGGLHRLFGQFNRLWGTSLLNVTFGGFEPRATPFSSHRRLLLSNYVVNDLAATTALLADGEIVTGEVHGVQPFSLSSSQRGIELWGVTNGPGGGGLEWAFGVTNGNGLGFAAEEEGAMEEEGEEAHGLETLDDTSSKDIYARFSYKFFGLGRSGGSGGMTADQPWRDDSVRLGVFAVRGSGLDRPGGHEEEDYRRYGADLDVWFKDLNLYGAYMFGNNRREAHGGLREFDLNSWFVEADYVLLPWVIPAVRYEVADVKAVTEGGLEITERLPALRRVVPHVSLLLRSNVRLAVEANRYFNSYADEAYRFNLDFSF